MRPLSSFSVTSHHCYLAPDMSPEIPFNGDILVEKFKARAFWLYLMSFRGSASSYLQRQVERQLTWGAAQMKEVPALGKLHQKPR